ncbi:MAG: glycolate oxidase subunit GlcE [Parasulfuritortus sp.]|nr:glycolate oxidase subunit GlcE [Parasulfuritortus sp.]
MVDLEHELAARVRQAGADKTPLCIRGGGSKAFYGRASQGEVLDVAGHTGVVSYEPTELVITARAGTPLTEIEALLADKGQVLPFEPPHFGNATLGGMLAAGLSGPRRPWTGAVRDAVLGVKIINGRGEVLSFGGQVMKNVAGYDVPRLMAGSMGTLAVILEASVKVLPRPASALTLVHEFDSETAARRLLGWARQALPLSGSLYHDGRLWLRLCGAEQGVAAASEVIGGEEEPADVWTAVREQTLPFFTTPRPLWRVSLPAAAPELALPGETLIEWGGALRWLVSDAAPETVRARVQALGGHATWFRGHDGKAPVFQPLPVPLMSLHRAVKQSLDPHGLFNPGRLYPEL